MQRHTMKIRTLSNISYVLLSDVEDITAQNQLRMWMHGQTTLTVPGVEYPNMAIYAHDYERWYVRNYRQKIQWEYEKEN